MICFSVPNIITYCILFQAFHIYYFFVHISILTLFALSMVHYLPLASVSVFTVPLFFFTCLHYLSIHLSVYLTIYLSFYPSFYPSFHPSIIPHRIQFIQNCDIPRIWGDLGSLNFNSAPNVGFKNHLNPMPNFNQARHIVLRSTNELKRI